MKGYSKLFVCHRTDNTPKCCQFLQGLLHDCKSNIERMVERIPQSDYDQLQHFVSKSPWDAFAVMDKVAQKVHETLSGSTEDTVPTALGLLLDESGWEKSGKKSVGVARQYIGQTGKIANGQVGVFASLSNGEQAGLLQGRLYLPKEWTDDPERCKDAGIPEDQQIYRTKPQLAVEIIKTLPDEVTYEWVGGDSIYGKSPVLRQHLYDTQKDFVLDVGENLQVYLEKPSLYIPKRKSNKGREPTRYTCDKKPIAVKDLIQQIPAEQWQTITHRQGTKGPMIRRSTIVDVHIWSTKHGNRIESVQLLISTETDGTEVKYSLCHSTQEKMSVSSALGRQMQRYWIERAFQNVKEQLGMNQYQVRSWRAWYHHIALTLMALHFVLEIQKQTKEEIPLISIPDIKLIFANKLQNNLKSDEGLWNAIRKRHQKRQRDLDQHSKVPK